MTAIQISVVLRIVCPPELFKITCVPQAGDSVDPLWAGERHGVSGHPDGDEAPAASGQAYANAMINDLGIDVVDLQGKADANRQLAADPSPTLKNHPEKVRQIRQTFHLQPVYSPSMQSVA